MVIISFSGECNHVYISSYNQYNVFFSFSVCTQTKLDSFSRGIHEAFQA